MPLTLILGPANSAKAGEVLAAYAAAARRDALLVLPTVADAIHYDRELAGREVLIGRAVTFTGLIAEVAARAGYGQPTLTARQRQRAVRRAVSSAKLRSLRDVSSTPGFPAAAGALFAELSRRRVTPARFGAAMRIWASGDPAGAGPRLDLAALYAAYFAELERIGRADADVFAWRALDALRLTPGHWGRTPVFFYGFDDLTPLERDAIETISQHAGAHVLVSLTYEPGRVAFAARAAVAQELTAIASSVRSLPPSGEHYAAGARDGLHHLERFLFEPGAPRIDPGEAVRLYEAGGALAEAELLAGEVLAARRAGVPAEEIVVVCRSLQRSGALLARVMRRLGLATISDRLVPVSHTAIGRALIGLGRCALLAPGEAGSGDLLAYLRAPGVLSSLEPVDRLDATVRRLALRSAEQAREAAGLELSAIDALRTAADLAGELARQTRCLLAGGHRGSAASLTEAEELEARAGAAVLEALSECADLGDRLSGDEILELLVELKVQVTPAGTGDAILIAEPLSIRARRFRVVLVSGLCADEFPARARPDPFLDDARRRELATATGLALGAGDDMLARERYLLYTSVSRATERLVLTYRSSDEDGQALAPSPFLDDIADLFVPEWRSRRGRRLLGEVPWQAEASIAESEAGQLRTRTLSEQALRHVRHTQVVSGGALEAFAACPVGWLVERQLEPRELAPEAEPLARGNFMHDVLERLIGALGGPVAPASLPRALALLDELTAELPAQAGAVREAAVLDAVRSGIVADLRRYLETEAADGCAWSPRALELRFGFAQDGEEGPPALVLSDGERSVRVRGTIDRVDVEPAGTRAIVRDYKSGANRPTRAAARWLVDHELQVGLYMLAVQRLLGLQPVAGFYQPLTGRDLRPRGVQLADAPVCARAFSTDQLEHDRLAELLAGVERDAVSIAGALARGELTPCPATCSRDGCRHPGICWAG